MIYKKYFFWSFVLIPHLFLQGCYTVSQGYYQTKLLLKRKSIQQVLEEQSETAERLEKLKWVPRILQFAREKVGLETGTSYTYYIPLEDDAVTWVVQAAEKRQLERKTWWFPVVGTQPYLGFFLKKDAQKFQEKLKSEGYDTRMGGVAAFSLLGYFSDPLYSSMIDSQSLAEIVDVLIHECTHQTLYVPNASTFNESFADFVAKKATVAFLNSLADTHELKTADTERSAYIEKYRAEVQAGPLFKDFLKRTIDRLKAFYAAAETNGALKNDEAFHAARLEQFKEIEKSYDQEVRPAARGTWYENAFRADRLNNAVVLAYSLYEAKTDPFEKAYARAGEDLIKLIRNLKACIALHKDSNEESLWNIVSECDNRG